MSEQDEEKLKQIRSEVNERYKEYPLVSDHFPLKLENGADVKGVVVACSKCSKQISPNLFRGEVRHAAGGCFRITGIGWCSNCELLTPFLFNLIPTADGKSALHNMEYRGWVELFDQTQNVVDMEEALAKINNKKKKRKSA